MFENVDEIDLRMISAERFPIYLFERGEILHIESYGQKQTYSEEPTQLKLFRSLE